MQTYRLMWGVVLMVTLIAAWVGGWGTAGPRCREKGQACGTLPQTGQTLSYAKGDDGDLQAGVAWPVPRFTDNHDGTVTDKLTGLIWLKDASCAELGPNGDGTAHWDPALEAAPLWPVAGVASPMAAWRATGAYRTSMSCAVWSIFSSLIPRFPTQRGQVIGPKATRSRACRGGETTFYWSSTTIAANLSGNAWVLPLSIGINQGVAKDSTYYVWPVRRAAKKVKPVAPVPQTGQTTVYAEGDDGDLQAGVAWPVPRFTDNHDGTVTDKLTGLIWLKDASCAELGPNGDGTAHWEPALEAATALASGRCGLTDGSVAGDWRLPNINELHSLVDFLFINPALSNAAGTGHWTEGDAFSGVQGGQTFYWSSTTTAANLPRDAWVVPLSVGINQSGEKDSTCYVWPVRGGN